MIDSTFDFLKFQIINSFMTINSNNLTYPKIIFIIFIYILYTNKYIIKNYITEKLDIKSHIYLEGKRHFNT